MLRIQHINRKTDFNVLKVCLYFKNTQKQKDVCTQSFSRERQEYC
jgi:hypothetical protein